MYALCRTRLVIKIFILLVFRAKIQMDGKAGECCVAHMNGMKDFCSQPNGIPFDGSLCVVFF